MITKEAIQHIAEEYTQGTGLFTVEVDIAAGNQIHIKLDGDEGVTVADCIGLNKFIEGQFDREEEDYSLEVSSYGVGNPLLMPRQYQKNVGRKVKVKTTEGLTFTGRMQKADDKGIVIAIAETGTKRKPTGPVREEILDYTSIEEAIIEVEF